MKEKKRSRLTIAVCDSTRRVGHAKCEESDELSHFPAAVFDEPTRFSVFLSLRNSAADDALT